MIKKKRIENIYLKKIKWNEKIKRTIRDWRNRKRGKRMKIKDIKSIINHDTWIRIWFNELPYKTWIGARWQLPKPYMDLDIKNITALAPQKILDDPVCLDIFVEQSASEVPLK